MSSIPSPNQPAILAAPTLPTSLQQGSHTAPLSRPGSTSRFRLRIARPSTTAILAAAAALAVPIHAATPTTKAPTAEFRIQKQWNLGGSGGWGLPAFDPASNQLFIPRNNRVMIVDTETGALISEIGGMKNVREIALDDTGHFGYLTDPTDGSAGFVRVIDRTTHTLIASIPTGRLPAGIAFDPATKSVVALNAHDHTLTIIDTSTNQPTTTISLPGRPASAIPDGSGNIYITLPVQALILRIDLRANARGVLHSDPQSALRTAPSKNQIPQPLPQPAVPTIAQTFPLTPCTGPAGLAIDPAHHQLFTTCENHKIISVDTRTGQILPIAGITSGPGELNFSPVHGLLFLSNSNGTLTVFHRQSNGGYAILQSVETQPGTRAFTLNINKDEAFMATSKFSLNPNTPTEELQFRPTPVPGTFSVIVVGR